MMRNLHKLFRSATSESLERSTELTEIQHADLLKARALIRAHIRAALATRLAAAGIEMPAVFSPKFITQGSVAYQTVNAPARAPQQADLDDGLYVPLSFCADTGSPRAVSELLIKAVEALLTDLARRQGWTIDSRNPNCTRVVIAPDKHVDMPIYSIPDDEFRRIAEHRYALAKSAMTFDAFARAEVLDDNWDAMPERVRLASCKTY